ncbi:MAG: metallopeptidase family protein [Verrucomicrobiota bacterium]|jgi:predicted Zn-dependent protease with MMP-like domain|nr:metallopeptidase family protein [Verrucomicrobiota bacterium]
MEPELFDRLLHLPSTEVSATKAELPSNLHPRATAITTTFELKPNADLGTDGIKAHTPGLFLGESMASPPSNHPQPAKIILFLKNLWECISSDEAAFLEETRITYLRELGHHFDFYEYDLQERYLD